MTVLHLHGDFETRSTIELPEVGIDIYSRHPTTDAWCFAYSFGDEDVDIWTPGEPCPRRVREHIEAGGIFVAHNAAFELAIWNNVMVPRHGWPILKVEQVRCTMATGYAMALPGKLEHMAPALGITERKDVEGGRLMLQMSRPRKIHPDGRIEWWDATDKLARLYAYCKQDVVVERAMEKRMVPLQSSEWRVWAADQYINNRGVYVDRPAIDAALKVVKWEQDALADRMSKLTEGACGVPTETARLVRWVQARGVDTTSVAKAEVLDLLAGDKLPTDVRTALLIRQEYAKASTAKLQKMMDAISHDGRVKHILQYHGSNTGRWAGRRIQPQNMPRWPKGFGIKEAEHAIHLLTTLPADRAAVALDLLYGAPMSVISWLLRALICAAPGHDQMAADFANIEGRGLAWLAGEDWKLAAFRAQDDGTGPEIYKLAYGRAFNVDPNSITKDDERRQVGKVMELALGYQGGVGAFQTMAKTYNVKVPDDQADEFKVRWREVHPRTRQYWYDLEDAALRAVLHPGQKTSAGAKGRESYFRVAGSFLWCMLPSKRVLCYPYPRVVQIATPWGELKDAVTYKTVPDPNDRKKGRIVEDPTNTNTWARISTYGGKLAENITQAICRDLLAAAILRCEERGYPVVLHVHDEVVTEVPQSKGSLEEFEAICSEVPAWAAGLPVVTEGWRGRRYRK